MDLLHPLWLQSFNILCKNSFISPPTDILCIIIKSCIKNRNMIYVHSIWTIDLVSKSGQTLLI